MQHILWQVPSWLRITTYADYVVEVAAVMTVIQRTMAFPVIVIMGTIDLATWESC